MQDGLAACLGKLPVRYHGRCQLRTTAKGTQAAWGDEMYRIEYEGGVLERGTWSTRGWMIADERSKKASRSSSYVAGYVGARHARIREPVCVWGRR